MKNLAILQIKNAIGDLAGSSDDISAAVIISGEEAAEAGFQVFQEAFWTEYVTLKQGLRPVLIRTVPGGGPN